MKISNIKFISNIKISNLISKNIKFHLHKNEVSEYQMLHLPGEGTEHYFNSLYFSVLHTIKDCLSVGLCLKFSLLYGILSVIFYAKGSMDTSFEKPCHKYFNVV
jgi:hypothetical protein